MPDRPPAAVRAAAAIVGLEALALVVAAGVLVVKTMTGHPHSVGAALSGAGLALFAAAVLALCARSLMRMRPSARTPVLVLQLVALPVSYSLSFQAGRVAYGAPILIAAVAVIYLLFTPSAREVLDRDLDR